MHDLELAFQLAEVADDISMRRFAADDLAVEEKSDGSPVTDADRAIETALRGRLMDSRPNDDVIGEETGGSGGGSRRWYIDPIDGTVAFAAGQQNWRTLIALVHDGTVVLGVASAPADRRRWWAALGEGAYCNRSRLCVSRASQLREATVNDDWRHTLANNEEAHPLAQIARACAHVRPNTGHSFLAVASGAADVAVALGGFAWDYAPFKVIIEEAGGRFTDFQGRDAFDRRHAIASNGLLHDEALRVLAESPVSEFNGWRTRGWIR